ncbi:tetracenomycin polyketide synthesis 8-O-methyl transferase TcmO-like [Sycon ciliatum]|uniref:tetracenomycin polyketide synthesis 8-O-methyl transferase TcmO-like n=1 Tax=Sycon ciliatum TaxID=27933 RepID=UPI0020AE7D12|eukprot:scpid61100/ scgid33346/ Tetracenomycin polyketide synthesis 8-O-methyl transferase tcmO
MASTSESAKPLSAEITTFCKVFDTLNAFKKTHVFRTAMDLGLFKVTRGKPMSAADIAVKCGAQNSKTLASLLEILVGDGFLVRSVQDTGDGTTAVPLYMNTEGADSIICGTDSSSCAFMEMMVKETKTEMDAWTQLTDLVKTGTVQHTHEQEHDSHEGEHDHSHGCSTDKSSSEVRNCHDANDKDEASAEEISEWSDLYNMFEGFMRIAFNILVEKFDFSRFTNVVDIGGGTAQLSRILCRRYKNLNCTNFDLPRMLPCAEKRMAEMGADVADRVRLVGGDCFKDDLPTPVDVVIIANVMHGFESEEQGLKVVQKAYDALSPGGVFMVIEDTICGDTSTEAGQLWELGAELTKATCDHQHTNHLTLTMDGLRGWFHAAGFQQDIQVVSLISNTMALVGTKA